MKRILVCLDNSPRGPVVASYAVDLAKALGARLSALRVVSIAPELSRIVSIEARADLIELMTNRAKKELSELLANAPPELIEGFYVHIGTPWDVICNEAVSLGCDMIVLGSHGYSGIDRIVGTTAAKVVNHSDRSVLVVRETPPHKNN